LRLQQSEAHLIDVVHLDPHLEVVLRQVVRQAEFVDPAQVPLEDFLHCEQCRQFSELFSTWA